MMSGLPHDLRFAFRNLSGKPGFTLLVVATLALGMGATTAMFSVVDGVLLRPVPFDDVDRLVMVWETDRHSSTIREPASVPDLVDFRERSTQVGPIGAFAGREINYAPEHGDPGRLAALAVTHDLLPTLGIAPLIGHNFTPEEDRAGGPSVALIGERFWARALRRDPSVVGQLLHVDGAPVTIVGVIPATSDFGVSQVLSRAAYGQSFADRGKRISVDVWLPLQAAPDAFPRSRHPIFVVGRLPAGATIATAQDEFDGISADLERRFPENDGRGVFVEPLSDVIFASSRPALLVLLGAVALVLLVACANVANLLLARGITRRREVAVRTALGASIRRLAQQFLVESLLLTLAAAGLGVIVAQFGLELLVRLAPADIPRIGQATVDSRVLGVTFAVSVLVALIFSLVPIVQACHVDPLMALKGAGGSRASGHRGRLLRSTLVVGELSMAMILVIGAMLLVRSFVKLQEVDPGFQAGGVIKAEFQLPPSRYPVDFSNWPDFKEIHAFNRKMLQAVSELPGVSSAAIAANHPVDPGSTNSFSVRGREVEAREWPEIAVRRVTDGYFRTMGVPLIKGRVLTVNDDTHAPPVLLINEAAEHRFFNGQNPLGEQLSFWGSDRTIVGVVGNERFQGLDHVAPPAVYAPLWQTPSIDGAGVLLVRTVSEPMLLATAIRGSFRRVDSALAVFGLEPLSRAMFRSVSERRYAMLLLGIFALVALFLAALGVHGVLSYTVAQRTREIGIRMALGARPGTVLHLVVAHGVRLAVLGATIGLFGAWGFTRLLGSLLFGVSATDPLTLGIVPVALVVVALAASYLPARRATRVAPLEALRVD